MQRPFWFFIEHVGQLCARFNGPSRSDLLVKTSRSACRVCRPATSTCVPTGGIPVDGRPRECCTAVVAVRGFAMTGIVDGILKAYGRELDAESIARMSQYLEILASAGERDDLGTYGLAYLEQLQNPDPRYSGC
jgi:hypothetical protein